MKILVFLIAFISTATYSQTKGVISNKAMVVSAREEASQIGSNILKKGGNAFDAMIATFGLSRFLSLCWKYIRRWIYGLSIA